MKNRASIQIVSGAMLGALAAVAVYEGTEYAAGADEAGTRRRISPLLSEESTPVRPNGNREFSSTSSADASRSDTNASDTNPSNTPSTPPGGAERINDQLNLVKRKLRDVQREKNDLEVQLSSLEVELEKRPESSGPGKYYEFELDAEEWRELATQSRIKYRIPCVLPTHPSYAISGEELDKLGLSPDDGKTLLEAHRRSNSRVWATLRPLCAQALGDETAVDLLGTSNCLGVIERAAAKSDAAAATNARRQVGEVHAGLRPPPEAATPLFQAFMALTRESHEFEADLAESFGPDDAKRIVQNMSCADTRR